MASSLTAKLLKVGLRRNWIPMSVILLQIGLSVVPFAFSVFLFTLRAVTRLNFGDWHQAIEALANSMILAAGASVVAVLLAAILVIVEDCITEAVIFSLLSLMIPGEFIALGMNRFVNLVSPTGSDLLKDACFALSIVGFVFPYVCACLILGRLSPPGSDSLALAELSHTRFHRALILLSTNRYDLGLAWVVGINMTISEATRTRILSEDLFGLGSQYFGPLVVQAFQARGLEQVYFFLSYLITSAILMVTLIMFGRSRS